MFSWEGRGCQLFSCNVFLVYSYAPYWEFHLSLTFILPDKPTEPVNVTVQEIRSNNTDCHVHNKLIWEPPVDDGDTPITSYIVEYKHPVFNRILISETVNDYREHVICKLQASGYPREVHVDVRAINKVGRGFRSRVVPVSFFSEFVCFLLLLLFFSWKRKFSYTMTAFRYSVARSSQVRNALTVF